MDKMPYLPEKRLINGQYVDASKVIARCHALIHRGYLTKNLISSHDCIGKKCPRFERLNPEYWQALKQAEEKKKTLKAKQKLAIKELDDRNNFIRETLEDSGHIHITVIRDAPRNIIEISYIYDRKPDLSEEIKFLGGKLKKKIVLKAIFCPDENIEMLIRKPRRDMKIVTDVRKAPKVGAAAKKRLAALGVYCLEDLFGRSGDWLYRIDCERSGTKVNRRYLAIYRSAAEFANSME
ncbi:MAG: hypothetical protein FWH02_03495 [Oscillospiraceae bacterium]|nr:hypothetical protein [Oscillospiraceae bacterium]